MPTTATDSDRILARCRELGFALAGICRAERTSYEQELRAWLGAGKHGEMEYIRRNLELRVDPRAMVLGAKSIICVADRYAAQTSKSPNVQESKEGSARGRIARYARGDDYHVVMRKRLARL